MRLQNYQRTFLRVNPPPLPPPFSSFRFLSPFSLPPPSPLPLLCRRPDMEASMNPFEREQPVLSDAQRDYELSKSFVKGIVRRRIVVTRCNIVSLFLVLLNRRGEEEEEGKMSFRRGSNRRCVRYIFRYDYRASKIECEKKKERNGGYPITFVTSIGTF